MRWRSVAAALAGCSSYVVAALLGGDPLGVLNTYRRADDGRDLDGVEVGVAVRLPSRLESPRPKELDKPEMKGLPECCLQLSI